MERLPLELSESLTGYYGNDCDGSRGNAVKVNEFYDFEFSCELGESEDVFLELRLDGAEIPLHWSVKELARSAYALRNTRLVDDWRAQLDLEKAKIVVDHVTGKARESALKLLDGRVPRWKTRLDRRLIRRLAKGGDVWVYTDGPDGEGEAWDCFVEDSRLEDGVKRYYTVRPGDKGRKGVGHGKLVPFGSRKHKMLFCAAKRVITSDADFDAYSPMPAKSLLDFADLFNADIFV